MEKLVDQAIYFWPLAFLGADVPVLATWAAFDAFWGMLVHSNVKVRLGPLIYVLNGPEMHLWHHCPGLGHRKNFGNNLSVLDWVLGTAHVPGSFPSEFGVGDPTYPVGSLRKQLVRPFRRGTLASAPPA